MDDYEYFSEADCDPDEIREAVDDGRAEPWRTDAEGQLWFRRRVHPAKIFGVPKDSAGLLGRTITKIANWIGR